MEEYLFQCMRREVAFAFTDERASFEMQVRTFYAKYLFPIMKGTSLTATDILDKGKVMFIAIHFVTEGAPLQISMLADKERKRLMFRSYDIYGKHIPLPLLFEAILEHAVIAHNKDLPPVRAVEWTPWEKEYSLEGAF